MVSKEATIYVSSAKAPPPTKIIKNVLPVRLMSHSSRPRPPLPGLRQLIRASLMDFPDSPLISGVPLHSGALNSGFGLESFTLSPLPPGSALAERIFNDPECWTVESEDEDDSDLEGILEDDEEEGDGDSESSNGLKKEGSGKRDPMAWFNEEMERFRLKSAESNVTAFSETTSPVSEDEEAGATRPSTLTRPLVVSEEKAKDCKPAPKVNVDISLSKRKRRSIALQPISLAAFFEHSGEEVQERVVRMILEEGKKELGLPPSFEGKEKEISSLLSSSSSGSSSSSDNSPSPISSPSTSTTSSSTLSAPSSSTSDDSAVSPASTLDSAALVTTLNGVITPVSGTGPDDASSVAVHSASTTLSFLEWYGIYPDSPASAASLKKSMSMRKLQQQSAQRGAGRRRGSMKRKGLKPKGARVGVLGEGLGRQSSMNLGAALASPSVLIPDMRVEPMKRGSSVPPLTQMRGVLREVVLQAQQQTAPSASGSESQIKELSDEGPANPPGLGQASVDSETPKVEAPVLALDCEKKVEVFTPSEPIAQSSTVEAGEVNTTIAALPSVNTSEITGASRPSTPPRSRPEINTPTPSSTPQATIKKVSARAPFSTPTKKLPRAMLETARRKPNMEIRVRNVENEEDSEDFRSGQHKEQQATPQTSQPPSTAAAAIGGRGGGSYLRTQSPVPLPRTAVQSTTIRDRVGRRGSPPQQLPHAQIQQPPATATHGALRSLPSIPPLVQPASAAPGGSHTGVWGTATPNGARPQTPQVPGGAVPGSVARKSVTPSLGGTGTGAGVGGGQPAAHGGLRSARAPGLAGLRQAHSLAPLPRSALASGYSIVSPAPTSGRSQSSVNGLLSPEMTPSGGQTIVFYGRPSSAVRSPMGGPAGPRSRASDSRVSTASRLGRPPGLEL